MEDDGPLPLEIEKNTFYHLMKNIGCYKNLEDSPKEATLLEEIWQSLAYRSLRKISVGDFKIFLMAIFSIRGNRRMGLENTEEKSIQTPYGWVNEEGQMCLTNHDITKI